ncbi:unnamed protein product [Caenorhabditis auriculariae]|uniref:Uncharacterized protein n=1 Tax=Caenorhabditis auriculariae TaxID=2777116 RepID=A0A8S1GX44_9PELO|nr:unnamed protein product [Caenorhabditis auriculariae]
MSSESLILIAGALFALCHNTVYVLILPRREEFSFLPTVPISRAAMDAPTTYNQCNDILRSSCAKLVVNIIRHTRLVQASMEEKRRKEAQKAAAANPRRSRRTPENVLLEHTVLDTDEDDGLATPLDLKEPLIFAREVTEEDVVERLDLRYEEMAREERRRRAANRNRKSLKISVLGARRSALQIQNLQRSSRRDYSPKASETADEEQHLQPSAEFDSFSEKVQRKGKAQQSSERLIGTQRKKPRSRPVWALRPAGSRRAALKHNRSFSSP